MSFFHSGQAAFTPRKKQSRTRRVVVFMSRSLFNHEGRRPSHRAAVAGKRGGYAFASSALRFRPTPRRRGAGAANKGCSARQSPKLALEFSGRSAAAETTALPPREAGSHVFRNQPSGGQNHNRPPGRETRLSLPKIDQIHRDNLLRISSGREAVCLATRTSPCAREGHGPVPEYDSTAPIPKSGTPSPAGRARTGGSARKTLIACRRILDRPHPDHGSASPVVAISRVPFSIHTASTATSAGVIPEIRPAWPRVAGRMRVKFT